MPDILNHLSWLWYLPAMFKDFMLTYPLLRWTIRRKREIPFDKFTDVGIILHQIIIFVIWALISYYGAPNEGPKYLVPSILVLTCIFACFYIFQLLIKKEENGYKYAMAIKLIGPLSLWALNLYKNIDIKNSLYHVFLMINYDAVFFA